MIQEIHECIVCHGRFSDAALLANHTCPLATPYIELTASEGNSVEEIWDWADGYEEATEIAPNVTLCTKDGRKIGNAIITRQDGDYWHIETDFGNEVKLSAREIDELYYLGRKQTYDAWLAARREKVG